MPILKKQQSKHIYTHTVPNIMTRLWQFRYAENCLTFTKLSGGIEEGEDWRRFMVFKKLYEGNRDYFVNYNFPVETPGMSKKEQNEILMKQKIFYNDLSEEEKKTFLPGFHMQNHEILIPFLEQWYKEVVAKSKYNSPCMFFSRLLPDYPIIHVFVATSCMDYVFATNCFREYSYLYRDGINMITALQIKNVPNIVGFRKKWNKWASQMNIIACSPRFMLVEKEGIIALYTINIPSGIMRTIQQNGMVWRRNHQLWSARTDEVNVSALIGMIKRDALPDPSVLGYTPEWHCSFNLGQKVSEADVSLKGLWSIILGSTQGL